MKKILASTLFIGILIMNLNSLFAQFKNSYVSNETIDVCSDSEPIDLSTIIDGEWSGSGVVNNILHPPTVKIITKNILKCGEKEIILTVHPKLEAAVGWTPKEIDLGKSFQLTGYPEGGMWYANGELFDGNFKPESKGIYEIIYIFKSKHGCECRTLVYITAK
jgi:hypothetical protein